MPLISIKKNEIVDALLSKKESTVVVLVKDSGVQRKLADEIGNSIRNNPEFLSAKATAFKVTNNMVRFGDTKIFIGLEEHEPLLRSDYSKEQVKVYAAE